MLPVLCRITKHATLVGALGLLLPLNLLSLSAALGAELIVNGGFTDGPTGWDSISSDENFADWFLLEAGSRAPASQIYPSSTQGNVDGIFAMSDSGRDEDGDFVPNQTALYQPFTVPANATSVMLTLDMYVNDWSGQAEFSAQQSARVDIIPAGTVDFSTSDSTIVYNAYVGTDGGPPPHPFAAREFELMPFVQPGQDYLFRTMSTAQTSWMQVGIDNVSIDAVVPEPNFHPAGLLVFWSAAMVLFSRQERGVSLFHKTT